MTINTLRKGLNSFQLKIIALIFMTVDHIAVYVFMPLQVPVVAYEIFRGVGRIAAPLFLFIVINSAQYTRSKPKLVLRLYVASVILGLLNIASSEVLPLGFFVNGNIFPTFMYTVLYIYLLENIVNAMRNKRYAHAVCFAVGLLLTYLPTALYRWSHQGILTTFPVLKENISQVFLIQKVIGAILPNVFEVEYSVSFVLLGILWYFVRNRKIQCGLFLLFSAFCFCVINNLFELPGMLYSLTMDLFMGKQYLMILALPFIYLYNSKKGRSAKWLFYVYYPTHQYLLLIIGFLLTVHT